MEIDQAVNKDRMDECRACRALGSSEFVWKELDRLVVVLTPQRFMAAVVAVLRKGQHPWLPFLQYDEGGL